MLTRTLPSSSVATATETGTFMSCVRFWRNSWALPAAVLLSACSAGTISLGSGRSLGSFFSRGFRAFAGFSGFSVSSGFSSAASASVAAFSCLGAFGFLFSCFFSAAFSCLGWACFFSLGASSFMASARMAWAMSSSEASSPFSVSFTFAGREPNSPNRPLLPSSSTSTVTSEMDTPSCSRPWEIASSMVRADTSNSFIISQTLLRSRFRLVSLPVSQTPWSARCPAPTSPPWRSPSRGRSRRWRKGRSTRTGWGRNTS